jgi:hypothetical protein
MAADTTASVTGLFLPVLHITLNTGQLQVYAYLFGICHAGIEKVWTIQREPAGNKTYPTMPPMGRKRI